MDINMFRERFGDVPQRGDLYFLCPLLEDPTDKASVTACPGTNCNQLSPAGLVGMAPSVTCLWRNTTWKKLLC